MELCSLKDKRQDHTCTYKVKETNFALVPSVGWIGFGATILVSLVCFAKEAFVPEQINVPMLHAMANVRCLDQMLQNNGRLAIHHHVVVVVVNHQVAATFVVSLFRKGNGPTRLSTQIAVFGGAKTRITDVKSLFAKSKLVYELSLPFSATRALYH